jgi:hypothetical protein
MLWCVLLRRCPVQWRVLLMGFAFGYAVGGEALGY